MYLKSSAATDARSKLAQHNEVRQRSEAV